MEDYRVQLDVYNGPLDLLLYLIQREEVDIYDIPIARITEQYLGYVDLLKRLDPNLAGEFLVLAATLMEIKTRMLLPPAEQGEDEEGLTLDPRAELVRQLLEYKAFKDAAGELSDAATEQALRFPRRPAVPDDLEEPEVDLDNVQIWDLFDAFSKLMESIGHRPTHHEVIYDDTPVELHAADLLDRLGREGALTFRQVFEGRDALTEIIGLFLALLELIRQRKITALQTENFGEIRIDLGPGDGDEAGVWGGSPSGDDAESEPESAIRDREGAGPPTDEPHDQEDES